MPRAIVEWTEGLDGPTLDFKRRVRLAEGFYLALCEALLARSPEQGGRLWRAIRASLTTRFLGTARVEQLVHMIFRVPSAPEALRVEQLDIANTNSDQELFDLALAADINGQQGWLDSVIAEDETSGIVWRRQRAGKLRGFRAGNRLPIEDAWSAGPAESMRVSRQRDTTARMRVEAFARHWWQRYWDADSDEEAYAAWELFVRSVDRRAYVWMRESQSDADTALSERQRRVAHFKLNFDDVKSAIQEQEKS